MSGRIDIYQLVARETGAEAQAVAPEEEVEGVAEWFNGEKSPITLSLELVNAISGSAVGSPFI